MQQACGQTAWKWKGQLQPSGVRRGMPWPGLVQTASHPPPPLPTTTNHHHHHHHPAPASPLGLQTGWTSTCSAFGAPYRPGRERWVEEVVLSVWALWGVGIPLGWRVEAGGYRFSNRLPASIALAANLAGICGGGYLFVECAHTHSHAQARAYTCTYTLTHAHGRTCVHAHEHALTPGPHMHNSSLSLRSLRL